MVSGNALVTGCSSGIGRAAAQGLAKAGFTTWATARRVEAIEDLAAQGCHTLALDVTDEASMVDAVAAIAAMDGAVAVLVNNAGYGEYGPVEELDGEALRRQFETNVFGLVRMCQLVLPGMRAAGRGRIINVSSMGGEMALPAGGAYHASKYAVEALSDVLRVEVAPFGVDVVVIQPGPVQTRFGDTVLATEGMTVDTGPYADLKHGMNGRIAGSYGRGRRGTSAHDVAKVIVTAATTSRPRTRYKIGALAYLLPGLRRWLPDRLWDAFLSRQFSPN